MHSTSAPVAPHPNHTPSPSQAQPQYDLALIAQVLDHVTRQPDELRAQCPVCAAGSSGSGPLSVKLSSANKPIYYCHASQCDWKTISDQVNNRLGIEPWVGHAQRQLGERTGPKVPLAEYEYGPEAPDGLAGQKKRVYRAWKEGQKKAWGKGTNRGLHVLFWREGGYYQSSQSLDGLVVLCEGEKAAAFLSRAGFEAACWSGGTATAAYCDLSRLEGKRVLIWADCDPPGLKAARTIKRRLLGANPTQLVRVFAPAGEWGADAADYDQPRVLLDRLIGPSGEFTPVGEKLPDYFTLWPRKATEFEDFIHANRLIGWQLRFNVRNRAYEATQRPSPTPADWEPIPKADGWLALQQRDLAVQIRRFDREDGEFTPLHYKDAQIKKQLAGAMEWHRRQGGVDDVAEWLNDLPAHDGQPRIERFLKDHFGAADNPLNCWASAALFVQIARRTLHVACRWRGIPILIGPQFTGKSALVQHLLPEHLQRYVVLELNLASQSAAMVQQFLGCAVVELSELAGMNRAGLDKVKSFITLPYDRQRLPYRSDAEQVDRRCAFIGTMNDGSTLPYDPSGSTRWICVECPGECNVEELFAQQGYRDQLFAEALTLVNDPRFAKGIDRSLMADQAEANLEHTESNEVYDEAAQQVKEMGYSPAKLLDIAQSTGLIERLSDGTKREFTMRQQKELGNSLRKVGYQLKRLSNKDFKGKYWILENEPENGQ